MATLANSEILRYLGYDGQEVDVGLQGRIDAMRARCKQVARPSVVEQTFSVDALPIELPGNDIATHLRDAVEVVFFAATLGHAVDQELRKLAVADPTGQVIFDAVATYAIERLANETEAKVRARAASKGLFCSWRFSPGYGDLPLDIQPAFLQVLNATRRLGITLTPSNLMVPTKSVTAIVGLHSTPQPGLALSCSVCQLAEYCTLRTQGMRCSGH